MDPQHPSFDIAELKQLAPDACLATLRQVLERVPEPPGSENVRRSATFARFTGGLFGSWERCNVVVTSFNTLHVFTPQDGIEPIQSLALDGATVLSSV